jgi:hypothetical protein
MSEGFPFSARARLAGVSSLIVSVALIGWSVVPAMAGDRPPERWPLMGALVCLGLTLVIVAGCSVEPCRRHRSETGRYLLPGRGGAFETRSAVVAWGVLGVFGMMGLGLIAVGLWAMVVGR